MIAPVDISYYERLQSRKSMQHKLDRYQFFYTETKLLYSKLIKHIIESESKIESLKKKISTMQIFSNRIMFEKIDLNKKGYFLRDDVIIIFTYYFTF